MRLLIFFFVMLASASAWSQNIQVDHYTGRPVISIPLIQASDRNLTHTVGLFYDASGLKVDAISGWVGLNWSLMAAGEVRRELHGLPDDLNSTQKGWLYNSNASTIGSHSYSADATSLNCDNENTEYTFINGFNHNVDTEPDIFHFSGGGISGSFVFDNTGNINNIKLIPYQDIKVKANLTGSQITSFVITDSNGIRYTFQGVVEITSKRTEKGVIESDPQYFRREYHQFKNGIEYIEAWKLTSIVSPAGETITFQYSIVETSFPVSGQDVKVAVDTASDPQLVDLYAIKLEPVRYVLSSITTPHQGIYFESVNFDITSNRSLLRSITVNEINHFSSSFTKTVYFNYALVSTFHSSGPPRIFLRDVKVMDDCKLHDPIKFEYQDINFEATTGIPSPGSSKQDIWGYHMSVSTERKVPKLYVYPGEDGINRITLYRKTGTSGEIEIKGVNRIQETTPDSGTLNKITYPSGASTSFTYEPHEFYNPIIDTLSKGGGLRVKQISIFDGITTRNTIVKNYEYKKSDGTSSGVLLSMPTYWQLSGCYFDEEGDLTTWSSLSSLSADEQWQKLLIRTEENLNPDFFNIGPVAYTRATEKISSGKGKTVYEYETPYVYGDAADSEWNPTYVHVARKKTSGSCPAVGLNEPGFYQHPFVLQTPYSFGRGLLTKTSFYAEGESNPEREVINEFETKTVSPVTVKALYYEFIPVDTTQYYFMYGAYKIGANKQKVLVGTTERIRSRVSPFNYLESETEFTYGSSNSFLASTSTTASDGTESVTRFKYAADFTSGATNSGTDLQVRMIESLNKKNQTSTLVEQTFSTTPVGGSEKTYKGSLYLFDNFADSPDTLVIPSQILALQTTGESSFAMSSFSGSGTSRTFVKDNNYKIVSIMKYNDNGDAEQIENSQRQIQSYQTDTRTGFPVAIIQNSNVHEVVYSNFDQFTEHGFDTVGFWGPLIVSGGKTGKYALHGWKPAQNDYIKKTFSKKPDVQYVFSAWYKGVALSGRKFSIVIKNNAGTVLMSDTIIYPAGNDVWLFEKKTLDLSSISADPITVEFKGAGSFKAFSTIDEVTFAPENTDVVYNTYHTAYGPTTTTAPDGQMTINELDASGRLKYVRDHQGNIRQKTSYSAYRKEGELTVPISITTESTIYSEIETVFKASTGCHDISSMEWKVSPAATPTSGSYFSGSDEEPYTFASTGAYYIWLKISHASYGSYEVSKFVDVYVAPLDVEICVLEGSINIDVCNWINSVMETEACVGETLDLVPKSTTTFSAVASGCPGGGVTYGYSWYKYDSTSPFAEGTYLGSGQTIEVSNANGFGYYIRCITTSSCGKEGTSNYKFVNLYRSDPSCPGPFAD